VLQRQLDDFQRTWRAGIAKNQAGVYDKQVEVLRKSGLAQKALRVGAKAPAFSLPGTSGQTVALADLLKQGPVVLVWYRGGWCPYCAIALRAYEEAAPQIRELGAALVAVSPQVPNQSQRTQELGQLDFEVLSDPGNKIARQYGLVYKLPADVVSAMHVYVDLKDYNGDDTQELPMPATYVIDTAGIIRYAFVDPDYRKRAEPSDVLAALRRLRRH
jgi:peroxiredoxin